MDRSRPLPHKSPYDGLPDRAFWRTGVAERGPEGLGALHVPRFRLDKSQLIASAGSCFAQHVGRVLRQEGFNLLDAESLPPMIDDATAQRFGYRLYSARYGNVYTLRQMRQLLDEAFGRRVPEAAIWTRDGRHYDALRPGVEPEGLSSAQEVRAARADHLARVRMVFEAADLFIFTLGLTEAWVDVADGTVYPTAPGTIAGSWDPEKVAFRNFGFSEILGDFMDMRAHLRALNPQMRFLLTVSPVPLTATASGQHVEVANARSKAVLRAVAAELTETFEDVDYFPSYEIITSQAARGSHFAANMRSVTEEGVATAMAVFLTAHGIEVAPPPAALAPRGGDEPAGVICEEALLEAFRA